MNIEKTFRSVKNYSSPHLPVVFLIDTSGSMMASCKNKPIEGVNAFFNNITDLEWTGKECIDVLIIEFSHTACVVQNWTPLSEVTPILLHADGPTALGEAIHLALDNLKDIVHLFAELGVPYFRPFIFLITDGVATDDLKSACDRLNEIDRRKAEIWALGIEGYNKEELQRIADEIFTIEYDFDVSEAMRWIFTKMNYLRRDNRAAVYTVETDLQKIEKDIPDGLYVLHKDIIW